MNLTYYSDNSLQKIAVIKKLVPTQEIGINGGARVKTKDFMQLSTLETCGNMHLANNCLVAC